jgi:hypothetical protein
VTRREEELFTQYTTWYDIYGPIPWVRDIGVFGEHSSVAFYIPSIIMVINFLTSIDYGNESLSRMLDRCSRAGGVIRDPLD